MTQSPDALEHSISVTLSFAALNPGADFSPLEMNVLFGVLFRNSAVSSALNTCSGLCPPSATRLAHSSGYRSTAAVSADAATPTILILCNDCLTLNLLNQPSDA
ncbi:hypothetical protein GQX74_010174 [Glossina fuscipes]|nr:hypothetical protein GQX74_010174 [Glossina fuscipes]